MSGAGKGRVGRRAVADQRIDDDVRLLPETRCFRRCRRRTGGDGRQRAVVDRDEFGRVLRRRERRGDDQRHRLADKPHPVMSERHLVGHGDHRAVGVDERDVGRALRRRGMQHRAMAVGEIIGRGQHRDDARSGGGMRRVDRRDFGMGMRRAQDEGDCLARQVQIVAVAAAPGEKPLVLAAARRLADPGARRRRNSPIGHACFPTVSKNIFAEPRSRLPQFKVEASNHGAVQYCPGPPMLRLFKNLLIDETGATAIEYGLIAALIALAAISAITNIGKNLSTTFNTVATKL